MSLPETRENVVAQKVAYQHETGKVGIAIGYLGCKKFSNQNESCIKSTFNMFYCSVKKQRINFVDVKHTSD